MGIYRGKTAQEGMAYGKVFLLDKTIKTVVKAGPIIPMEEYQKYLEAKEIANQEMDVIYSKTVEEMGEEAATIIDVQKMMLEDADFEEMIEEKINGERKPASEAVSETGTYFHDFFASLDDPYMKARSADISDLAGRLVRILSGETSTMGPSEPSIIVTEDLLPSELLSMDMNMVVAVVTQRGSLSSHVAIVARTSNIPAIMQTNIKIEEIKSGDEILVDAYDGVVILHPDAKAKEDFMEKQKAVLAKNKELQKLKGLATETKNGKKIILCANIGSPEDAKVAIENDAEGIGLFRSEFLFIERTDYPSEEEQFKAYKEVAQNMQGKQVIVRTVDIGADKTADYFKLEPEENPALGYRAIRICFDRPEMFMTQLRALYRASAYGKIAIMFPMITSLAEVRKCKEMATKARQEVIDRGTTCGEVELGIMIETPAAALESDLLAKEVDFFSVGTNDLQQYVFAVDRQNDKVEYIVDKKHSGFLRLLKMIADNANAAGIWAGICGGLGADLEMTETFIEMGYKELSVTPTSILKLREHIRSLK